MKRESKLLWCQGLCFVLLSGLLAFIFLKVNPYEDRFKLLIWSDSETPQQIFYDTGYGYQSFQSFRASKNCKSKKLEVSLVTRLWFQRTDPSVANATFVSWLGNKNTSILGISAKERANYYLIRHHDSQGKLQSALASNCVASMEKVPFYYIDRFRVPPGSGVAVVFQGLAHPLLVAPSGEAKNIKSFREMRTDPLSLWTVLVVASLISGLLIYVFRKAMRGGAVSYAHATKSPGLNWFCGSFLLFCSHTFGPKYYVL